MIKQFLTSVLFLAIVNATHAQTLNDLSFGTDATFEVMTWNIEHFPKEGATTVDYIKQIIENLDADLYALQEIEDELEFNTLVDGLDGYDGYFASNTYAPLAYIYKSNTLVINDIYEIYTSYSIQFPRSPLIMDLTFSEEHIIVINNHFKALGDGSLDMYSDGDEEFRRYEACRFLKEYIDVYFSGQSVIVVGDMNDILTDVESDNVFQLFLDDTENYAFADMAIAEGSDLNWSYPFSSYYLSHLDHVLITNELFDEMDNVGSTCETIKIDNYLSSYDYYVSDHRPVGLKLNLGSSSNINTQTVTEQSLQSFPNPFSGEGTISFNPVREKIDLEIYNISGQLVYTNIISASQKSVIWNASGFPEGIYFAKILLDNKQVKLSKMVLVN